MLIEFLFIRSLHKAYHGIGTLKCMYSVKCGKGFKYNTYEENIFKKHENYILSN